MADVQIEPSKTLDIGTAHNVYRNGKWCAQITRFTDPDYRDSMVVFLGEKPFYGEYYKFQIDDFDSLLWKELLEKVSPEMILAITGSLPSKHFTIEDIIRLIEAVNRVIMDKITA
jgi:hypothetical protein